MRGWSNYYSSVVSKETFFLLDHFVCQKLRTWAKSRGNRSINMDKYWKTVEDRNGNTPINSN
ncbi:MAG: hypothetical protein O4806_16325 [Trichodesmium sp. St5_bin8]|nr:hypothetical protein [Trichodesmium sp. MAG_R01]MDE5068892.1 hypothetical protein [Trichodesmium sp. St4_bin8_1]MDE5073335.1 hypothetical protein [Trichodesmium sp. St5_bin8]